MIVWISGPTGSGKTTLAQTFSRLGYAAVEEKIPPAAFNAFLADPCGQCAQLQEQIMKSRFEAWRTIEGNARIVFDRSIDEDSAVFCRMHHDLGFITAEQYKVLRDLAERLQRALPVPDVILFMRPEFSILSRRVEGLAPPIIANNLERQFSLYEQWVATRTEDVLVLDNSNCSVQKLQQLFSEFIPC